ncbi:PBECR2 nuclease fold domain-containing protein [uncultured Treponema sp.]|uniref:PBECR2 nuclease fold domain-containing protein n=1 Tax=uncultured Treponema sp. TaxID=162155 RepID=UPI0025D8A93F|nr:PBECR2 nuclease fold domain-containing protein [uncultured Treponema sp.]
MEDNILKDIDELKNSLKDSLRQIAKPIRQIDFTRENYNMLFPYSRIKTPLEEVKLDEHQFEKLEAKERQSILQAVHDTLKTPDIVINETRQSVFGDFNTAHLYAKSFEINGKNKAVQSVVVAIEDENVSISTHERDINNLVNKIKMPEQLIYASDEIGQVIERATGRQLVTVNPTRANGKTEPPRENITQNNEKSTSAEKGSELNLLYEKTTVNVDGLERECGHGVLDGFKNAVKMVDRLKEENIQLKKENIELHKRLEQKSHSKNHNEKEIER